MRYFLTITFIIAMLTSFGGCDDDTPSSDSGDTSEDSVGDYSPDYADVPADSGSDGGYSGAVANLGESICGAFDRGASASDAASVFISAGISPADADGLVYLAVNAYCPEHLSLVG